LNLLHMQVIPAARLASRFFDVNLDGFFGDAFPGGTYLKDPTWTEFERARHRGRRFINEGRRLAEVFLGVNRSPFTDDDLLHSVLSVPKEWRRDRQFYGRALRRLFPEYFGRIGYNYLHRPVPGLSRWENWLHELALLPARIQHRRAARIPMVDYGAWFRSASGRDFFGDLIEKPRYAPDVCQFTLAREAWQRHLAGANESELIGRYATLELWLRQVFDPSQRPALPCP
jgi:hypothetical protein